MPWSFTLLELQVQNVLEDLTLVSFLDQEEQWSCTSCQLINIIWLLRSLIIQQAVWTIYTNTSSCYMLLVVLICPSGLLLFEFPTTMITLASLALCIMYIPYHSDTVCVCWILFRTPLGVFLCVPLRISHCLDSLVHSPSSTIMINTIAYSFVAQNGPKSFTKLQCFDSHCRHCCWECAAVCPFQNQ